MWDLLTVEDLFLAGAGFGIAGSVLLAKGLFPKRSEISRSAATIYGWNPEQIKAMAESKVAGWFGIAALAIGFVSQVVGTLSQVGIQLPVVPPSWMRLWLGLGLAVAAFAATWALYLLLRGWLVAKATPTDAELNESLIESPR